MDLRPEREAGSKTSDMIARSKERESERESSRPRNSSKNQKGCELVDDLELLLAIKKE